VAKSIHAESVGSGGPILFRRGGFGSSRSSRDCAAASGFVGAFARSLLTAAAAAR
jgi:hypothetical protein